MRTSVFVISPIVGSAIAGGLSWFFGGAIAAAAPLYAASVAAGALAGALLSLGTARAAVKELARERASKDSRAASEEGTRPFAKVQDVREMRELVTGLARLLRTAEEIEAARSASLEKAVREASSGIAEAARHLELAGQKVAEVGRALSAAEGGGERVAPPASGN